MRIVRILAAGAICAAALDVQAMPNFARREGFDCATCHVNIPRLNRFGYEYRNAGFRIPSMIGEAKQAQFPEFGTMNTARLQSDWAWHSQREKGTQITAGELTFLEATLYPVTGSFGRWWSSEGELSVASEDFFEVENAYLRGTFGNDKMHGNVRIGVFHPFEGYGASDRPLSIARPTFQRSAARWRSGQVGTNDYRGAAGTTQYTPWGFDEVGLEAGVTYQGFNIAATVFNGLFVEGAPPAPGDPDETKGFPFQGGDLVRTTRTTTRPGDPNYNAKDFQIFANQFIGDAAVSAHWYHGTLSIPVDGEVGTTGSTSFTDNFDRLSLYGTYVIPKFAPAPVPQLWVLAGFERGWDTGYDVATASKTSKFGSQGWFGEIYSPITPMYGASVRYDWFDSSRSIADNTQQAVTVAFNAAALNGAQGILEYRHVLTNLNAVQDRNRDQLELRLIYIF